MHFNEIQIDAGTRPWRGICPPLRQETRMPTRPSLRAPPRALRRSSAPFTTLELVLLETPFFTLGLALTLRLGAR